MVLTGLLASVELGLNRVLRLDSTALPRLAHLTGKVIAGLLETIGDAPVPFDEVLDASGTGGVRGLPAGRLRGYSKLVASGEYRWLLTPWLDAVLSFDYGNAFGQFEDFASGHMFSSLALAFVVVDAFTPAYFRAAARFGVQVAVTPDDGLRVSFALYAW